MKISFLFLVFLWDVYLTNEKETTSFNENDLSIFNSGFGINSSGGIYFSREILSNVHCLMDVRKFPHDTQHCEMSFESYAHTVSELILRLIVRCQNASCDDINVLQASTFKLIHISEIVTATHWDRSTMSKVVVKFTLQRQLSFYLYQV